MNLQQLKETRSDTPEYHTHIHELFTQLVNSDTQLKEHRDFVEQNVFGMGERSFWWVWMLVLSELPENPKLLEIGVFKAATLSLWKLLRPDATCYGVTPLDGRGTGWTEDDYSAHIKNIHDRFVLAQPELIIGGSEETRCVQEAQLSAPYDVVYIDGDHSYEGCLSDLLNYAPLVSDGGFLVIDDACCDMHMKFGYFQGIQSVTDATLEYMKDNNYWEFFGNVVHLRIYKRK